MPITDSFQSLSRLFKGANSKKKTPQKGIEGVGLNVGHVNIVASEVSSVGGNPTLVSCCMMPVSKKEPLSEQIKLMWEKGKLRRIKSK